MSNETKERRENTMCVMTSGPAITPQRASAGVQEVHIVLLKGHGDSAIRICGSDQYFHVDIKI